MTEHFGKLKEICVPLLASSLLTPSSVPNTSKLLSQLIQQLRDIQSSGKAFDTSEISYIFFPVSAILRRNPSSAIPDQIFEKIFVILGLLCEDWWWTFEVAVWEQIFMLCGSIIGGIEGKGKGKQRDDETREAAASCLWILLRHRDKDLSRSKYAESRLEEFQQHARSTAFVPILGQTLNSLLLLTDSHRISLQRVSLEDLDLLVSDYLPDHIIPSVLPGVVSTMSKLALGEKSAKGWSNGDIVEKSLSVMQTVIVKSIGDEVCRRDGAVRVVEDLEEFAEIPEVPPTPEEDRPYATSRTPSWLLGTASQLHIALNALTPLVKHPTSSALLALTKFSLTILSATISTLPQSQALLMSFLLSLSVSEYPTVSTAARASLLSLLSPKTSLQSFLMQTLMHLIRDNLAALPRFLSSQADAKVEHVAGLIEAVCHIATEGNVQIISIEIGKLLGPAGGIEKWGYSLLSVLPFLDPPVSVTRTSSAQLMLERDPSAPQSVFFPELSLRNVSTRSTYDALVRMFQSLGMATGDACLPAVEWFVAVGHSGTGARAVAALWCACQLLQGSARVSLFSPTDVDALSYPRSKRLEKFTRELSRSTAQLWDDIADTAQQPQPEVPEQEASLEVSVVKGLDKLHETLHIGHSNPLKEKRAISQPIIHRSLSLQILAVASGILQSRFTTSFLYTLYPILHSLVSPVSHLSATALATLDFVTISTSYASPANLLMSNFDYALDAVSRRLSRRWLDVDATKVLVVMIHIIGNDVVERAADVVEECFDRLDEFHGYEIVVEGLVEVLGEVIKVIEVEEAAARTDETSTPVLSQRQADNKKFEDLVEWFRTKDDSQCVPEEEEVDYGSAPREAWGSKGKEADAMADEEKPEADDPVPTASQSLTKQIVARSMFFLTHGSPVIRARILTLLASAVSVLHESSLMPAIHSAWPFLLNRLSDRESFVVSATAALIEALSVRMGDYMYRRIWDDVWPRFHKMLEQLDAADATSALARRGRGAVGTESAYTHSHRLYRSLIRTMTAAAKGVETQDSSVWQVILSFRRFLHVHAHEELQQCARDLYVAVGRNNADAVWLALHATMGDVSPAMKFLRESKWDITENVTVVMKILDV
ncbi:armadillo-type protein [Mycena floridula]|nr:armadillo-type protein [Mycena floridula]